MAYPWQSQGGIYPWQVGQVMVDEAGVQFQVYPDQSSPTGYIVKRTDANGTSFQPVTEPINPTAAQEAMFGSDTPYGRRLAAAEAAAADQNTFNRGLAQGGLDVQRRNAGTSFYNAETTREIQRAQIEQAKKDLQFRYYQQNQNNQIAQGGLFNSALQIGAGLRGPEDWDAYLQARAMAGQNPLLQQAGQAWSSLTNIRPNTGARQGPAPRAFTLESLAGDFMGGGGGNGNGSFELPRDANLDAVAAGTAPAPGWWQGLSKDERARAAGYWSKRGESPSSILNSLAWQQPNQGLGYGGA